MIRENIYAVEKRAEGGRPSPAIFISAFFHVVCIVALAAHPAWWPWFVSAVAGNHVLLGLAVFFPRGVLLGSNLTRLPASAVRRGEVCLTFDDGPDPEVTPRVLDLLDRYRAKASFFCIGEKAAAFPDIVRDIARRGHSIENHSYRHSHAFAFYGVVRLRREVVASQVAIASICGRPPAFFRAPAGYRSVLLDPVLTACGLRYVSWTRRGFDAVRRDPAPVLRRLTRGLAAGDVLLLHDGASARMRDGEPVVLAVLPPLLAELAARGLTVVSVPAACSEGRGA
jgi:peptidoglycan/xylan/chitin deacetylase (PgdA/CDA1 family)